MNPIRRSAFFFCPIVFLVAQCCPPARGDALLNYQFSGEIIEVDGEWDVFGSVVGQSFAGNILLFNGEAASNSGGVSRFQVDTVGQPNQFNAAFGLLDLQPTSQYLLAVSGPASGFIGVNFDCTDVDPLLLDHSALPNGYSIRNVGFFVQLLSSDLGLSSSFPDLPNSLHPLSAYGGTDFGFYADIFDAAGNFAGSVNGLGSVNSLQAVPEPAAIPFFACLLIGNGFAPRRRLRPPTKSFCPV